MLRDVLILYSSTLVKFLRVRVGGRPTKLTSWWVCYRPHSKDKEADEAVYKQLAEVMQSLSLVLVEDFNLPDLCCKCSTAQRNCRRCLDCMEDNFTGTAGKRVYQWKCPVRPAVYKHKGLMRDVVVGSSLGHSENDRVLDWFSVKVLSNTNTLGFQRADFGLFRTLVGRVHWVATVPKGKGVQEGWTFLKKELSKAQEQAVPVYHKTSWWERTPTWLKGE